ncbi:hypothetical protein GCM10023169_27360 [Georgenia halophila]|uniref:HTH luxR-type domain-containing protein n=2 Tax=Georgenia halophila TaxID=620889 RepID=A0ABP8LEF6_9MICO
MFEPLGIGARDIAVYRALLADPDAGESDLAVIAGADEQDVSGSLSVLEERGFLRRSHTAADRFHAEPPQVAFERLLGDEERDLHRAQERLSLWRAKAAELVDDLNRSSPSSTYGEFERLVGVDDIVTRMRALARAAKVSVDSIVPNLPAKHGLDQARVDDGELLDRGIAVRAIYQPEARQNEDALDFARWFSAKGGQIRTALDLPNRLVLFDRDVALFLSDPLTTRQGAIVLNTPGAVTTLQAYFELLWSSAEELGLPAADYEDLKPEERDLLKLLSRGDKDEAIARSLGVSIRTVRRMTNNLSTKAGASSRFELGVKAVAHGWVDA